MIQWLKKVLAFKSFFADDSIYKPKSLHVDKASSVKKQFSISNFKQYSTVSHSSTCKVFDCNGSCWEFVPDKIVREKEVTPEQMKKMRLADYKRKKRLQETNK